MTRIWVGRSAAAAVALSLVSHESRPHPHQCCTSGALFLLSGPFLGQESVWKAVRYMYREAGELNRVSINP